MLLWREQNKTDKKMLFYKNLCLHKSVKNARKSGETERLIKTTLNELNFQAILEKLKKIMRVFQCQFHWDSFRCKEKRKKEVYLTFSQKWNILKTEAKIPNKIFIIFNAPTEWLEIQRE